LSRIPQLGPEVPRRASLLLRGAGRAALALLGWRIEGRIPNVPRCVIVVAPHTSNWDFVVGIAAVFALGLRVSYLGKHSLFRGPLGWFLRATGGIPVDRGAAQGVVERAVEQVRRSPRIFLALSPEGTRKRVPGWKSGYHRIATAAGVPILPVALDYPRKAVVLMELFAPGGELVRDEAALRALFSSRMARHPEGYQDDL
jgi:1-acyl-sn-glycerol-3-phosphate acyltransferase